MEALALGLVPWLVGLSLVCFVLYLIVRRERRPGPEVTANTPIPEQWPAPVPPDQPPSPRTSLPYARQRALLTNAERDFFAALCAAAPDGWHVFPQVRLANLVQVRPGTRNWRPHFSRIAAKCVDFVLCEPAELSPRLVVELDDASHNRPDRKERDAFVDAALNAAGIPILHVRWQRRYDVAHLAERVRTAAVVATFPVPTQPRTPATHAPLIEPARPPLTPPVRWACRSCGVPVGEAAKFCNSCEAVLEITP